MIGKMLAHYEVLSKLCEGGMGAMYLAKDTKLGREVELKILPDQFAKDQERLARFHREARTLAALNHPNIAAIHGQESDQGLNFLAMELAAGRRHDRNRLAALFPSRWGRGFFLHASRSGAGAGKQTADLGSELGGGVQR